MCVCVCVCVCVRVVDLYSLHKKCDFLPVKDVIERRDRKASRLKEQHGKIQILSYTEKTRKMSGFMAEL